MQLLTLNGLETITRSVKKLKNIKAADNFLSAAFMFVLLM